MSKTVRLFLFILMISFVFLENALAEETPILSAVVAESPDPYTVVDVQVDKSAKNAVVAREEAIAEAQRLAFQKLAERNLTPAEFKIFSLPDDKTIASVVQDFEIKNEQLSFTRYAANFTVRFRDGVRNFINVKIPEAVATETAAGEGVGMMEEPTSKVVLILPYMEDRTGRAFLWEDPNPWRLMWQSGLVKTDNGERQIFVPLGDIGDVSAGSSDAVWSGDYAAVEKLRRAYNADEVILAVASKPDVALSIDIYSWKDGTFAKKETLTPSSGALLSEADSYKIGALEVLKSLQQTKMIARPVEAAAEISREIVGQETPAAADGEPSSSGAAVSPIKVTPFAGPGTEIDAMMQFTNFSSWIEMQKRLSSMAPPVKVEIRSINKGGASFTMKFQGSAEILKKALADNGIALSPSAVEVDPSVLGGAASAQRPVYDLQLLVE